jgi:hypothetical protein
MSKLNVVPFDETIVNKVYSISINVNNIVLFQSANIVVNFFDINKIFISTQLLTLAGDDYTNWGDDDEYIINYVATTLNITILDNGETGNIRVQTN